MPPFWDKDQKGQHVTEETDLTGKILIAMPEMGDPRFEHAVVFYVPIRRKAPWG